MNSVLNIRGLTCKFYARVDLSGKTHEACYTPCALTGLHLKVVCRHLKLRQKEHNSR